MGQLEFANEPLRLRLGHRYEECLEQARTAIIIRMTASDIPSPLIAAVHLGVSGDLADWIGSESDAFAVLIQAALGLLSCFEKREGG